MIGAWTEAPMVRWFKVEDDGVTLGEPFDAMPGCTPIDNAGVHWFRSELDAADHARANLRSALVKARMELFRVECSIAALNKQYPEA